MEICTYVYNLRFKEFFLYLNIFCIMDKITLTARAYLELLQKDHTGNKLIRLCVFNALCNNSKKLE